MVLGMEHHGYEDRVVLVSTSKDGDLAIRLLQHHGYRVIRGSTSRRGSEALRELLTALNQGRDVVLTPDGPRGPRHSMNPGPVFLARETGRKIIPIGLACDRAWRLKSWDRFTIPKFRARVAVEYGKPLHVPTDSDESALDAFQEQLREEMLAAERRAFAQLDVPVDWEPT